MLQQSDYYETTGYGMGTMIEQKVAAESAIKGEEVCQKVTDAIRKLEGSMSYFIPESSVFRLNVSNGVSPVKIDSETFEVLKTAHYYYILSEGAFDITTAPFIARWREYKNKNVVPTEGSILKLRPYVSGDGLILDEKSQTAKLKEGQSIDLGGIGKGYAADIAIQTYKSLGVNSAFINLGGNVHTLGQKVNGEQWVIGIQDPRSKRGDYIAAIAISDMSVVTSGDYEKYYIANGKRYHHILDPKTGYPANSDLMSATVLSHSSMEADALSTAVFVSGLEKGMELIEKSDYAEGVLITKDNEVYVTRGLEKSFFVQDKSQNYKFYFYS